MGHRSQHRSQPIDASSFGERCVECMVEMNAVCFCGVESAECVGENVAAFVVEGARRDLAVAWGSEDLEHVDIFGYWCGWWVVSAVCI